MTEKPRITLPGGSEAARFGAPADTRRVPATIVETAFAALDAALAEAVEAIDRLDSPVSDDPAHADILAEDLKALEDVLAAAARVTAHVPLVPTDRALIAAAHFIAFGLRMQSPQDRRWLIEALRVTHPIFAIPAERRNARRVVEMIDGALTRLTFAFDALGASAEAGRGRDPRDPDGDLDPEMAV